MSGTRNYYSNAEKNNGRQENRIKTKQKMRNFQCKVCKKRFLNMTVLKIHFRSHTKERPFTCKYCKRTFTQLGSRNKHIRERCSKKDVFNSSAETKDFISTEIKELSTTGSHGNNKIKKENSNDSQCKICSKNFSCVSALERHTRVHTKEKTFICQYCGLRFKHKYDKNKHERDIHGAEKQSKYIKEYSPHKSSHCYKKIIKEDISNFLCKICDKQFKSMSTFEMHFRVHKPFTCQECGTICNLSSSLKRHMQIHNKKNLHNCDICGKQFKMKIWLDRHAVNHVLQNYNQLPSNICQQIFKQNPAFANYLQQNGEIKTGKEKCETCGKLCASKSALEIHKRVHTKEKPYSCKVCGKSFAQQSYMKKHDLVHSKKRPYKCELCGKGFYTQSFLNQHMKDNIKNKPYNCTTQYDCIKNTF